MCRRGGAQHKRSRRAAIALSAQRLGRVPQLSNGLKDVLRRQLDHTAVMAEWTDAAGAGAAVERNLQLDRLRMVIVAPPRIGGPEQRDGGNSESGGEMTGSAVGRHHQL